MGRSVYYDYSLNFVESVSKSEGQCIVLAEFFEIAAFITRLVNTTVGYKLGDKFYVSC